MKKVMVVTSTRAEYGLLKPVIQKIQNDTQLQLMLVATGAHLCEKYGNTITEIENDGFTVDFKIDIMHFESDDIGVAKTIAYTTDKFIDLLSLHRPDMVVVLGDRYEIFAVATAVSALGIPLAHISGGDVTQGAKDDFYRHCITKMSNLHFPSCQESYDRLLRLGENPNTVFNVGGLGDENIKNIDLMPLNKLQQSLEFENLTPFALITYHPETQKGEDPTKDMQNLLDALDKINLNLIFTKANADAGGAIINQMVDDYCNKNSHRAKAFFSLGLLRYLSAMKYAKIVIGNSSSGVVETPTFKTPCVNIGDRQKGRYIAENVVCTTTQYQAILDGVNYALTDAFKQIAKQAKSPYDNGCIPSEEIVKHINEFVYHHSSTITTFYDGAK